MICMENTCVKGRVYIVLFCCIVYIDIGIIYGKYNQYFIFNDNLESKQVCGWDDLVVVCMMEN